MGDKKIEYIQERNISAREMGWEGLKEEEIVFSGGRLDYNYVNSIGKGLYLCVNLWNSSAAGNKAEQILSLHDNCFKGFEILMHKKVDKALKEKYENIIYEGDTEKSVYRDSKTGDLVSFSCDGSVEYDYGLEIKPPNKIRP